MSGVPSWALSEPSTNRTAEWTTLCGWMTTSIASYANIVQPVRLDHFQALVRERRRVDRDLGAHPPRRVAERLLGGDAGEVVRVPSRNGPPDAVRIRRATLVQVLADQALPDRGVLGIDRAQPGRAGSPMGRAGRVAAPSRRAAPRASGMTRCPPATSVSLLAVATTLPARERGEDRPEADDAAGRHDDEVDVVARRQLHERPRRGRRRLEGRATVRGAVTGCGAAPARASVARSCPRRARRSGTLRVAREDVERLAPDRAGRAEDAPPPRRGWPRSADDGDDIQRHDRGGEQERVDPVEDPAVARDQRAASPSRRRRA